jgi:CBS domain-containing protein/ribosome-associated translation inhibitor RaiA
LASEHDNPVEKIQTKKYKKIDESATIGKALSLFDNSIDILVVLDKNSEYAGILMERSILRTDLDPGKSKVKSFKVSAPKVQPSTKIQKCARLMIENNILHLPVLEKGKVKGIVSFDEILKSPVMKQYDNTPARNLMTDKMVVTTTKDKVSIVYNKFKKSDIYSLPVVEDGRFIGMVNLHNTVHTIIQHKEKPDFGTKVGQKEHLLDLPVQNIMTRPAHSVSGDAKLKEIIELLTENQLDCISILDKNDNLISMISVKDLLKLAAREEMVILPNIQINSHLENLNRRTVTAAINELVKKYSSVLSPSEFEVYMREHREKQKHQRLIYTRIQAHAHKDKFAATAEGFGVEHSLKEALEKLEKQVRRRKNQRKHGGR